MLRMLWLAIVALVVTLPVAILIALLAPLASAATTIDSLIRWWARRLTNAAGIRLAVENPDRLHPHQRYILVANHYSYLDIPCVLASISQPIRFMAKVSLFRIPIFGSALTRSGFIPIDRKNRRTAVKSFDLAAERIRKGNTIVIFPEEGRTSTRALRPFQRGAFLLALKSQLPIVPVAIDGTHDVFPVGARGVTPGQVTVRIGEPIATAGLTVRQKDPLAQQAKAEIERMLGIEVAAPVAEVPEES